MNFFCIWWLAGESSRAKLQCGWKPISTGWLVYENTFVITRCCEMTGFRSAFFLKVWQWRVYCSQLEMSCNPVTWISTALHSLMQYWCKTNLLLRRCAKHLHESTDAVRISTPKNTNVCILLRGFGVAMCFPCYLSQRKLSSSQLDPKHTNTHTLSEARTNTLWNRQSWKK